MINNSKHLIKYYSIIPLLIISVFLSTRLLLKAGYGIELKTLSEETLFLICTSLWLICIFSIVRQVVSGGFKQQAWYSSVLIVFAKSPIDWGYDKLMSLEILANNMWLSLYHPAVWTCVICLGLSLCTRKSKVELI